MKFGSVEFVIGSWFASAVINGDYSGFDDAEERMINRFRDSVEAKHGQGHWNGFGEDDCVGFALCEVSGLRGDCYVARYCFAAKEETKCQ